MKNPFLADGALGINASINKIVIEKLPFQIDEELAGKTAMDIFSTRQLVEEIKRNADSLCICMEMTEEKDLPRFLADCFHSEKKSISDTAEGIARKFGRRLALILMTIKKGEEENRKMRKDWTDAHWDYWAGIQTIILSGGLASGEIGRKLKYYYEETLREFHQDGYQIILGKDSAHAALYGCASHLLEENADGFVVLDYGQSFVKRSFLTRKNGKVEKITVFEKMRSEHVDWIVEDPALEILEAENLSEYMLNVLINTVKHVESHQKRVGNQFILSIANYVRNGTFAYRGGYGKLSLYKKNYGEYFEAELGKRLGRQVHVFFLHDGTAMAEGYPGYPDSVCVSLGTAFGVGFPKTE